MNFTGICKKCGKKFADFSQRKICVNCEGSEGKIPSEEKENALFPSEKGLNAVSPEIWEKLLG